jgi:phosphatidylglycerol:prolipoprotein diacylglycerol transferase
MYPFIHIGSFQLGTFGLLVWLAAVCAGIVLHQAFTRDGVDADAMNVVVFVLLAGVFGSKLWHELQSPAELRAALHHILLPGRAHLGQVAGNFLEWLRSGFAWFGGLLAGIAMLLWQGREAKPNGLTGLRAGFRMLDLAAPAAAVGYGIGRIGCLTSGDGDYGRNTTAHLFGMPMGVHMAPNALVPPSPFNAAVLPTPIWEFIAAMLIAWVLWRFGRKARPLGWLTGLYLLLSGTARFLVEFYRINPRLYFHHSMSNAQVAAAASAIVGATLVFAVRRNPPIGGTATPPVEHPTATPAIAT